MKVVKAKCKIKKRKQTKTHLIQFQLFIFDKPACSQRHFLERLLSIRVFMITAEIHARSLADFYCQYADRHMNLKFMRRVSERELVIRQCYRKKQIDVSFLCVCPVIDHEFRHHIVKVVCGSTRLSPRGSTATLTM